MSICFLCIFLYLIVDSESFLVVRSNVRHFSTLQASNFIDSTSNTNFKLLVLGGTGFVGREVVKRARQKVSHCCGWIDTNNIETHHIDVQTKLIVIKVTNSSDGKSKRNIYNRVFIFILIFIKIIVVLVTILIAVVLYTLMSYISIAECTSSAPINIFMLHNE